MSISSTFSLSSSPVLKTINLITFVCVFLDHQKITFHGLRVLFSLCFKKITDYLLGFWLFSCLNYLISFCFSFIKVFVSSKIWFNENKSAYKWNLDFFGVWFLRTEFIHWLKQTEPSRNNVDWSLIQNWFHKTRRVMNYKALRNLANYFICCANFVCPSGYILVTTNTRCLLTPRATSFQSHTDAIGEGF